MPPPIVTHDLPGSPLSPPESLPSPGLANGQSDESLNGKLKNYFAYTFSKIYIFNVAPLRRPHLSIEDLLKGKTLPESPLKAGDFQYSIEFLARLAMSPLCLSEPKDWEHISTEYPNLVRKVFVSY